MAELRKQHVHILVQLYAVLIVELGLVFTTSFYLAFKHYTASTIFIELFEAYCYITSIVVLVYMEYLIWRKKRQDAQRLTKTPGSSTRRALVPHAIRFDGEPVNAYLRVGVLVFGLGSLTVDILMLLDYLNEDISKHCYDSTFMIVPITESLFVAAVMIFILRHHRLIMMGLSPLLQWGMVHVISSQLCHWTNSAVIEAARAFVIETHSMQSPFGHSNITNHTVSHDISHGASSHEISHDAPHDQSHGASHVISHTEAPSPHHPNSGDHHDPSAHVTETISTDNSYYCLQSKEALQNVVGPYLYPITIQFSLISAVILYKIYSRRHELKYAKRKKSSVAPIRKPKKSILSDMIPELEPMVEDLEDDCEIVDRKVSVVWKKHIEMEERDTYALREVTSHENNNGHSETDNSPVVEEERKKCNFTHYIDAGVVVGTLVLLFVLISTVTHAIKREKDLASPKEEVYFWTCVVLYVTTIAALVAIFRQLQMLALHKRGMPPIDRTITFLSILGVYAIEGFVFIPVFHHVTSPGLVGRHARHAFTERLLEFFLVTFQSVLVVDACHRRPPKHTSHTGVSRWLVSYVMITNISLWVINNFQVKTFLQSALFTMYYSRLSWSIIIHVLLPVSVLYHFQAAVSISELRVSVTKSHAKVNKNRR